MKYLLMQPHYIGEKYLDGGTEVGTGTAHPLPEDFKPSLHMAPMDAEAEKAVKDWTVKKDRGNPIDRIPTNTAPYSEKEKPPEKPNHEYDTVRPATNIDPRALEARAANALADSKTLTDKEAGVQPGTEPAPRPGFEKVVVAESTPQGTKKFDTQPVPAKDSLFKEVPSAAPAKDTPAVPAKK